ncbi:MAG: hypothetical protein I4O49_20265 [Janthinobacterium lividum]|nr:hypothetical protein [Janthinobacterium lividum]
MRRTVIDLCAVSAAVSLLVAPFVQAQAADTEEITKQEKPQQQWLLSGLRIVRANDECASPDSEFAFAADANGRLMACFGDRKWRDAEPLIRIITSPPIMEGGGLPVY